MGDKYLVTFAAGKEREKWSFVVSSQGGVWIYHKKVFSTSFFSTPPSVKSSDYEEIAVVEGRNLEDIFRKMNVVDGTELPVCLKVRSLSCGDVVIDDGGGVVRVDRVA